MGRDEILRFLEAVDAALVGLAGRGERLDLHPIGRSALILRYGLSIETKDVDVVHFHGSRLESAAVELFGRGTANAGRVGFHLEPAPQGLPPIPGTYLSGSEPIPGPWVVLRPMQPGPHDLAVTKLKRFHAKDREDLQVLCDSGDLDADRLRRGLESAFAWAEKEGRPRSGCRLPEPGAGRRIPRGEGAGAVAPAVDLEGGTGIAPLVREARGPRAAPGVRSFASWRSTSSVAKPSSIRIVKKSSAPRFSVVSLSSRPPPGW